MGGQGGEWPLLVIKEIKVGNLSRPGQVLAGHADEVAGEAGVAGGIAFVGENAGVEGFGQPLPFPMHAVDAIAEPEPLEVHFHPEVNGPS